MAAIRDLPAQRNSEASRRLNKCERNFWRHYDKAVEAIRNLQHDGGLVLLFLHRAGLPEELGRLVIHFIL